MSDLPLDTVELARTATALDQVSTALAATDRAADVAADGVGHRGLAAAVQEFADGSARQRHEIAEATTGYAKAVRGVADAFTRADAALAASARGEG
ncbi:hypothetical protein [Kineococcus aurantiacus]|uniref:Excreted virulence factor EspC (Type VII ESX diderm) n=1 Tax=Kineococcus aurantiacus TaxID=37633 RepID=A0A7Y9DJX1_9ACTN|nr:hypothetical protein [Kineococcus aurantiacus]NYD21942.1 hypothetical protein [Kineococcus aurantiacus]